MIISDLLDKQVRGIFTDDKVLKGDLIALDAKDGRILFDTSKNKKEYIEKFKTGQVLSIWADLRNRGGEWNGYYAPVIKCYVSHDSLNRIVDERVIEPIKNGELVIKEERPKCEWLTTGEEQGALGIIYKIRKCSKCGWEHSLVIPDNYCPNCGAEKRKEEE